MKKKSVGYLFVGGAKWNKDSSPDCGPVGLVLLEERK